MIQRECLRFPICFALYVYVMFLTTVLVDKVLIPANNQKNVTWIMHRSTSVHSYDSA